MGSRNESGRPSPWASQPNIDADNLQSLNINTRNPQRSIVNTGNLQTDHNDSSFRSVGNEFTILDNPLKFGGCVTIIKENY